MKRDSTKIKNVVIYVGIFSLTVIFMCFVGYVVGKSAGYT